MSLRVDSPDPMNVVGELQARGDNVMSGGITKTRKQRNATFYKRRLAENGDLGLIDKDNNVFN